MKRYKRNEKVENVKKKKRTEIMKDSFSPLIYTHNQDVIENEEKIIV